MYTRRKKGFHKHFDFILIDILCLQTAFVLAYIIRFAGYGQFNPYADVDTRRMAIILILVDIIGAYIFNSFKNVLKRGYYMEFAATIKHVLLVGGVVTAYLFATKEGATYSRQAIILTFVIYAVLAYIFRLTWKWYLTKVRKIAAKRSVLLITTENMAENVIRNFARGNYDAIRISGLALIDKDAIGTQIRGVDVVANADTVADYACRGWVDEIFIHADIKEHNVTELANKFIEMGIVVHVGLSLRENVNGSKILVEQLGGYHVLTSTINYATPMQAFMKRSMDIVAGFFGCLVTVILFIFLAPMIYIKSPGPIFFGQTRIGKNGKKFKIYKFRSMYVDAEERKKELMAQNRVKDGMMFKLDFDPRIIGSKMLDDGTVKKGLGNFIRDFSLDEFPQFWNVLKGDMSLIGTRPPTEDEWEKYELHHRARLAIKPGITGMWQVSGRSKITDFEEVVKLDTEYITKWSMGLDLRILFKTVKVVLGRDGSM